jgi:hypothetical protein
MPNARNVVWSPISGGGAGVGCVVGLTLTTESPVRKPWTNKKVPLNPASSDATKHLARLLQRQLEPRTACVKTDTLEVIVHIAMRVN